MYKIIINKTSNVIQDNQIGRTNNLPYGIIIHQFLLRLQVRILIY